MVKGVQLTSFGTLSKHRDLRFGLNLPQYISYVESFANSKYPRIKLGKIISLEYGKGLTEEERSGSDFPVMGSNGIVGYHDEFLINGPSIIVGRKGSAGAIVYIEENSFPIDTAFYVKPLLNDINIKFLSHLLEIANLNKLALFKGVPGLNRYDAYELLIPIIPKKIQDGIIDKIKPITKNIEALLKDIKEPLMVINEVFAEYYGYNSNLWRTFGKGMTAGTQKSEIKTLKSYNTSINNISTNEIFRISSRFHNPLTKIFGTRLCSKPTLKLGDIIKQPIKRGVQPRPDEQGTYVAIKTGQLKNGYIDISEAELLTDNFFISNKKAQIQKGDILIASTGKVSLGKVDIYEFEEDAVADGHISIVRIDEAEYDSWFLAYFLRSILGAFQIERDYTGTTNQIELYPDQIANFDIPNLGKVVMKEIVLKIKKQLDSQDDIRAKIKIKRNEINLIIKEAIRK